MRYLVITALILLSMTLLSCGTQNVGTLASIQPTQLEYDGQIYDIVGWYEYSGIDIPIVAVGLYQGHCINLPLITPEVRDAIRNNGGDSYLAIKDYVERSPR